MTTEGTEKLWNWAFSKLPLVIGSFRCKAVTRPKYVDVWNVVETSRPLRRHLAMSHSARIRMSWPSRAQFTAISPSLVPRLPRTLTLSTRLPALNRQTT